MLFCSIFYNKFLGTRDEERVHSENSGLFQTNALFSWYCSENDYRFKNSETRIYFAKM